MFRPDTVPERVGPDAVASLHAELTGFFSLWDTTIDWPEQGYIRFRGTFICDLSKCFDELRQRFERHGFTPVVREAEERIELIAIPTVIDPPPSNALINLILFILTILSTLAVGALNEPGAEWWQLWKGWPFSFSLLLILGAHELGHYFAARSHNVPVTLPYFIPFPTIFGTLGAVIRLKGPVTNRRALLDVGASGPLVGLVFAIPILLIGLATSETGPLPATGGFMLEGNSLFYALAKTLVFGRFLPSDGIDVLLNQVAWAGWAGLFVTGLNLFPVGQLDGGHILYSLFGNRARVVYWPMVGTLVLVAFLTGTLTWTLWILLLLVFGRVYAEPLDDVTPLDTRRRVVAWLALFVFIVVFVPLPIQICETAADCLNNDFLDNLSSLFSTLVP